MPNKFLDVMRNIQKKIMSHFSCRVSFGSSKGSMVETLVFETPTPLPEHAEREFTFDNSENQINGKTLIGSLNNDSNLEDSGIGLQEE